MYNIIAAYYALTPSQELNLIRGMANGMIGMSILTFSSLYFVTAPYGRYARNGFGFTVNAKLTWFIQELPSLLIPGLMLLEDDAYQIKNLPNRILFGMVVTHYVQRSLIFPFLIRGGKPTPLSIGALATCFCIYNGFLQGRYLTAFAEYDNSWLMDPRFIIGICLFCAGISINLHSDHILRNLRKPGEFGYKIPRGGMFEYVSGANFFGEILEWFGYAVASWSLPATAFAIYVAMNIGPRAYHHHRFYLKKFDNYPKTRKVIIPFIF